MDTQFTRRAQEKEDSIKQILRTMARHNITLDDLKEYDPPKEATKDDYRELRSQHKPTRKPKPVSTMNTIDIKPFSVNSL